jgi:chromosome segregation ATPase
MAPNAQVRWTKRGGFSRKLRRHVAALPSEAMEEKDRDEAVKEHLEALDDEIARLRRMEAAMDRRIAAAEDERRAIEDATRPDQ